MRSVYVSGLAINNLSHLPPHISAKDRAKKYPNMLHESGGKLFCSLCNKILDYKRKSTIDYHLSGSKHLRQTDLWNQRKYKQLTMSEMCGSLEIYDYDWVRLCTALNIHLSKSDHPLVRNIPKSHQLQEKYLGEVSREEKEGRKVKLSGEPAAVIFDETPDVEGRCILNIDSTTKKR
uniref:U1-type domain-containing protein n=1 Tax=Cyprinus carpio carpio TaxID=630221 RepID=A0A9J7XIM7_CYPCA